MSICCMPLSVVYQCYREIEMNKPRMPVHHLPPLPDVKELDAHGNDITDKPEPSQNQWAQQIQAQANSQALAVRDWTHDTKLKTQVKIHEWPEFTK